MPGLRLAGVHADLDSSDILLADPDPCTLTQRVAAQSFLILRDSRGRSDESTRNLKLMAEPSRATSVTVGCLQ